MKQLCLLITITLSFSTFSSDGTYFCKDSLESLPIQQGGRVKPLFVHAKESLKYLTDKTKIENYSSVVSYCLLSLSSLKLGKPLEISRKIHNQKIKKLLSFTEDQSIIKYNELTNFSQELRLEYMKQKFNTPYKKGLQKLLNQIQIYADITSGSNWLLPEVSGNKVSWIPINTFLLKEKKLQEEGKVQKPFEDIFNETKSQYIKVKSDSYLLELTYKKAHFYKIALLLSLVSIFLLVLRKSATLANISSIITLIIGLIAITFRVIISGRAPITNMYETVLFSGLGSLLIAIIIYFIKKEKIYLLVGLCYNVLTLMMISFANDMLDPSIKPLVPVLRDNFWLSTHVTCVILSYSAYALSWVLSNIVLIKRRFGNMSENEFKKQNQLIYTNLKVGSVLLAAGIILGGVWADYSWGRFWGWDPKETWSLIAFMIYMAILHGKQTNWLKADHFPSYVAVAFLSIMFAWFGVNYILAAGLHSYGFSEGGAVFLSSFFGIQLLILLVTNIGMKKLTKN